MRNLISLILLILAPLVLSAQTSTERWQVEGEVDILTTVGSKPTSERGQVGFSVPSFKLSGEYLIEKNKTVFFEVQMAEHRDATTQKQQLELARALYQNVSDDGAWIFRYGLLRNAYLDDAILLLDYDIVPEFRGLAYRFNYLPETDLGAEVRYVPNRYLYFSLGLFNGEENTTKEGGADKDTYIGLNYHDSSFHLALLAIRGGYDEYEKPFNVKERNLARIAWRGQWLDLGFEGMTAKELSNAVIAYKRADGWDGSAFPEVVVNGTGVSGWLLLKFSEEAELLLRKDYLDPYKDQKKDEIDSENIGLILKDGYRSVIIGYTKTQYKELHSLTSPEKEYGFVGLRQLF